MTRLEKEGRAANLCPCVRVCVCVGESGGCSPLDAAPVLSCDARVRAASADTQTQMPLTVSRCPLPVLCRKRPGQPNRPPVALRIARKGVQSPILPRKLSLCSSRVRFCLWAAAVAHTCISVVPCFLAAFLSFCLSFFRSFIRSYSLSLFGFLPSPYIPLMHVLARSPSVACNPLIRVLYVLPRATNNRFSSRTRSSWWAARTIPSSSHRPASLAASPPCLSGVIPTCVPMQRGVCMFFFLGGGVG